MNLAKHKYRKIGPKVDLRLAKRWANWRHGRACGRRLWILGSTNWCEARWHAAVLSCARRQMWHAAVGPAETPAWLLHVRNAERSRIRPCNSDERNTRRFVSLTADVWLKLH